MAKLSNDVGRMTTSRQSRWTPEPAKCSIQKVQLMIIIKRPEECTHVGQLSLFTGDTVHLMQPDTYDQFEVPKSMWGDGADFVVDSLMVDVHFYEDQPMTGAG